jgi:hypothetical protein
MLPSATTTSVDTSSQGQSPDQTLAFLKDALAKIQSDPNPQPGDDELVQAIQRRIAEIEQMTSGGQSALGQASAPPAADASSPSPQAPSFSPAAMTAAADAGKQASPMASAPAAQTSMASAPQIAGAIQARQAQGMAPAQASAAGATAAMKPAMKSGGLMDPSADYADLNAGVQDTIPAELADGEYVLPRFVVQFFGAKQIEDWVRQASEGMRQLQSDGRVRSPGDGGDHVEPDVDEAGGPSDGDEDNGAGFMGPRKGMDVAIAVSPSKPVRAKAGGLMEDDQEDPEIEKAAARPGMKKGGMAKR